MITALMQELSEHAMPQVVMLLLACVACMAVSFAGRHGRWLAGVALLLPILALALTMFELAHAHARALELLELVESRTPLPPLDLRSYAMAELENPAAMLVGQLVAIILPVGAWVAARVWFPGRDRRGHRAVVIAAAGVIALALTAASLWANEFIFYQGFANPTCKSHGWWAPDLSSAWLSRSRAAVVLAGASFGVGLCVFAVAQARRGVRSSPRAWAATLALLGLGVVARLSTADFHRDAQDYFPYEPRGRAAIGFRHGAVPDPVLGPVLDHCSFDWPGGDVLEVLADTERQPDEELVGDVRFHEMCGDESDLDVIVADPELPLARVKVVLEAADAKHVRRLGIASMRPVPTWRATTGEFIRVRPCAVEFRLGPGGVPLERFATWGELAAAADAGNGALVITP